MIYSCFCRRRETIAGKYVVNISFSCWVNEKFTGPLGEAVVGRVPGKGTGYPAPSPQTRT